MGDVGIFVILQYALMVTAILFFFEMLMRGVKALEKIAKFLETQSPNVKD